MKAITGSFTALRFVQDDSASPYRDPETDADPESSSGLKVQDDMGIDSDVRII